MILLVLLLFPQLLIAQADQIILPEIELVIEDQSTLNTASYESAILRDRSPQFQDVYLDEITSGISDASIAKAISLKDNNRLSYIGMIYGSFNNFEVGAFSQNIISNVFYKISYDGQFRGNTQYKDTTFKNTSHSQNIFNTKVNTDIKDTFLDFEFSYEQYDSHFINKQNQNIQYIPIDFNAKYWVDERAYIDIGVHSGFSVLQLQDIESIVYNEKLLVDGELSLMYKANFTDNIYFEVGGEYLLNDYTIQQAHTGMISLKSDFMITKYFTIRAGFGVGSSSEEVIFGWPEVAMIYRYFDYFVWDIVASGDFNLYNAQKSSKETQVFSLSPSPESRFIYASSIKISPKDMFYLNMNFIYNDYHSKRIYEYDGDMYYFNTTNNIDIIEAGADIGVNVEDIFDIKLSYHYQHIPKDWLLYSPHRADIVANIGYKPVGFNLKTSYSLYAPRMLTEGYKAPMIHLLNFKISQKIEKIAEAFIEVNNVLNQNIQFIDGTYYGGIQANGGITVNF